MSKMFWAALVAIVIIFTGIIVFSKDEAEAPAANAEPTSHLAGEGKAGVTLVEYGDFECPGCAQFYPMVEQLKQKYQEEIHFQFRHLPLIQIHQNAFAAARAAEAAAKQDKFWEMYDLLFRNQADWSGRDDATDMFAQYANQLDLDVEQFKEDAASSEVNDIINADIAEYAKTGEPKSTPTFFLNGEKITATSVEGFSKLIDEAIAAKAGSEDE